LKLRGEADHQERSTLLAIARISVQWNSGSHQAFMTFSPSTLQALRADIDVLIEQLPSRSDGDLIYQSLLTLVQMAAEGMDRLDWKILRSSLLDLKRGFQVFSAYRHTRKISIFGSSRLQPDSPEYRMAVDFARCVTEQGYMVITGAGGGIMEAGNKGAGPGQSFGLNIQLPFEQGANPYIEGDPKLVDFKYFFTRKLLFLRETDAIALFPGGFGTQDEAFECLTLSQTGKSPPIPLVLIDRPGGTYWRDWDAYICNQLTANNLISPEDHRLYSITDNLGEACQIISDFYRVYHSSRYVSDRLVIRLNQELTEAEIDHLNQSFQDIVLSGKIEKGIASQDQVAREATIKDIAIKDITAEELPSSLPADAETLSQMDHLPRLTFHFNQRDHGRLYQMIAMINQMGRQTPAAEHPERK
jgi:uncharacterized protein (TIGR00730 family)